MLNNQHLPTLLESLTGLYRRHDRSGLYNFVLDGCCSALKAQGGTFFSVRPDLGELRPEAAKGIALSLLQEIPFKMKNGISGWVATHGRPALVENAAGDERFNQAVDVITGVKTRSVMCVPVLREDRVVAVIELINRVDGVFREVDLDFVRLLTVHLGVALENCDLYRQTQDLLAYTGSVINSLTGGFISTDRNGVVTRCNLSAGRILSVNPSTVAGKPILNALPQYPAFSAILDVTQKNEHPVNRQEIEIHRADGSPILIGYSTFLIRDDARSLLGAGVIFQDLTHIKRA